MDTLARLRETAAWLAGFGAFGVLIALALRYGLRRRIDPIESRLDAVSRASAHEQRMMALFPDARPLADAPRLRPEVLGPGFSEPDLLRFAQIAFEHLLLQLSRREPPLVRLSDGALEAIHTLLSWWPAPEIREVIAGEARLLATDRGEAWRTVDLALTGLLVQARGDQALPWRIETRWRLRLRADAPLPSSADLLDLDRPVERWELLSVLDQERARLDLLPPALAPWGETSASVEPAPEHPELEASATRAALAILSAAPDAPVMEPLRSALAMARAAELLCGRVVCLADLEVTGAAVLRVEAGASADGFTARVALRARRWLEDASGQPVVGDHDQPVSGALILSFARASADPAAPWLAWKMEPATGSERAWTT